MANPFFSGRIPPGLADKIDAYLLTTGETRSELLIRLLRAEVSDDKNNNNSNNIGENNIDNTLSDLIRRVQKLEAAANNKSDNIVSRTSDNKTDNTPISLVSHENDNKLDNKEELVTTDDKFDNDRITILQEDSIARNLNPIQLADLAKIHERKKVTKAKSKKLLDLGMICEIGGDSILTKLGESILEKYQT